MKACDRLRPALVRSVEGEATPEESLRIGRHLGACTACRIVAARARRLAAVLDGLDDGVALDEERFFTAVMAALPDTPPPAPAGEAERRRRAWLSRKRAHLASVTTVALVAGGAAAQSLQTWVFVGGGTMPRFAESPEQASGALSALAALVGVALERLGAAGRLIGPAVPDLGLAAAAGLAIAGLAIAGLGAAAIAAAWRGRAIRV